MNKCACGRDGKYAWFIDGKQVDVCNKRKRCPSYDELEVEIETLKSHLLKIQIETKKRINAQILTETDANCFYLQIYDHCKRVLD